ncbi:MAG TPA: DNA topoisomerase VI subunit B [Planctomycetota bacterium]|nr:DNA topoisomerase VI subunit B [Planctomycetota bacterium]
MVDPTAGSDGKGPRGRKAKPPAKSPAGPARGRKAARASDDDEEDEEDEDDEEEGDEAGQPAAPRKPAGRSKTKAHELAEKQREISVSEFFAKNRHLLGFDSKRKALLTTVKEAVDNALDASEEADLLPDVTVRIEPLKEADRFRVIVGDNGPGIVAEQIDNVFARLLYGSKFHRLRQSRGQQGIGISAAGMYGQMTTGAPTIIKSKIGKGHDALDVALRIDTAKNMPVKPRPPRVFDWDREHGTEVTIDLEAEYRKGKGSVDEYLAQVAIANPHVQLSYWPPDLAKGAPPTVYERATKQMPAPAKEIQPHPHGVELGFLMKMMKDTESTKLGAFLHHDFSRVSTRVAREICEKAKLDPASRVKSLGHEAAEALYKAINDTRLMAPPTDCVSPIGEDLIRKGLQKEIGEAEFFVSRTRNPAVYRGNPFQIEVGCALGGSLPADEPARLMRFANRVPLLWQGGGCAITKAVLDVDWRAYGLSQPKDGMPVGPVIFMVHIASAWVPFTSESKEAVASYPEIIKEIKLALQECGRQMQIHLRRRARIEDELKKRSYIDKYIPHIGEALQEMLGLQDKEKEKVIAKLRDTLEKSRKLG